MCRISRVSDRPSQKDSWSRDARKSRPGSLSEAGPDVCSRCLEDRVRHVREAFSGQDYADVHQRRQLLRRHADAPHLVEGHVLDFHQLPSQGQVRIAIVASLLRRHGEKGSLTEYLQSLILVGTVHEVGA